MKNFIFLLFLCTYLGFSQTDLDVFVMDFTLNDEIMNISGLKNISNNPGYDSQPFFTDNNQLLYAGIQNGQTDIVMYNLSTSSSNIVNITTPGGEYSPKQIPGSKDIAAVRLDPKGLQRLYSYKQTGTNQGASRKLLDTLEVAYFAFFDNNRIVASVLGTNQLNLVVANLKTKQVTPYIENSGRSIHNIPQSTYVSYTLSNEDKNMDVYILDLDQGRESFFVCQLPVGVQDHCWINDSQLLLGSGSKIYLYDMFGAQQWEQVADLAQYEISDINRIAVNPLGNKIALVGTIN
jgi:Tol biopolymer transport system component